MLLFFVKERSGEFFLGGIWEVREKYVTSLNVFGERKETNYLSRL